MTTGFVPPMLAAALDAMPVAATLMDGFDADLPVVYANPAFVRLTGYPSHEIEGRRLMDLHRNEPGLAHLREAVAAGRDGRATLQAQRRDGTAFVQELQLVPLRNPEGALVHWLGLHQEKAPRSGSAEAELKGLTGRFRGIPEDMLTGLHSRSWLQEALEREVGSARRHGRSVTLFLADVDAFAAYNEVFGRLGGDALLRQVARTFSHCFRRANDGVARWQADTLAALAPDLDATQAGTYARTMLARVRDLALHHPRARAGRHVTLSIGAGVIPAGSRVDAAALIAAAEEALRAAQSEGGDAAEVRVVAPASETTSTG